MRPSWNEFLSWSKDQIAAQMAAQNSQTGVIFLDGSRRWFMLENGRRLTEGWAEQYVHQSLQRHIEIFNRCFEHGITTLITPTLYTDLLLRDAHYDKVIQSVDLLAKHPAFLSFYEQQQVQVHFFGDFRQTLPGTRLESILPWLEETEEKTRHHTRHRLFYGFFSRPAGESVQEIARLSIEHFQHTGQIPNRQQLIRLFYGAEVDSVSLVITFNLSTLEYPLLGGKEHLYFTVPPSMYLDDMQLRRILYDHLFLRSQHEVDYNQVSESNFKALHQFYDRHKSSVLGCGALVGQVWIPETGESHENV